MENYTSLKGEVQLPLTGCVFVFTKRAEDAGFV